MTGLSELILQVGVGGFEWVIVIVIIVVLIFGVKKIPELARSFGKASSEYEKAKLQAKKEIELIKSGNKNEYNNLDRQKLETIADTLGIDYSGRNDEDLRDAIEAEIKKKQT